MKDLIERIRQIRLELKSLKLERNKIQSRINSKEDVLEELEKLTVNQLDLFEQLKQTASTARIPAKQQANNPVKSTTQYLNYQINYQY